MLDISQTPFVAWRIYLRDICLEIILREEQKIGGEGVYVQIDESLFARKK